MIEKEQKREVFFNHDPLISKNELFIKTANTNPEAVFSITVQEYFDRGNAKIEQQDYEGAYAYFSRAIVISHEMTVPPEII